MSQSLSESTSSVYGDFKLDGKINASQFELKERLGKG
jgi:hypothetical protein